MLSRNRIAIMFLAAAMGVGGTWWAWNSFENHLTRIRKGSVIPAAIMPPAAQHQPLRANGQTVTRAFIPPRHDPVQDARDDASVAESSVLRCQALSKTRDMYSRYLQEPTRGWEKYALLSAAADSAWSEDWLGIDMQTIRSLIEFHAQEAFFDVIAEINSHPHDHIENDRLYTRAINAYLAMDYDTRRSVTGLTEGLAALEKLQSEERGKARIQAWNLFKQADHGMLASGTRLADYYLDLYDRHLSSLTPQSFKYVMTMYHQERAGLEAELWQVTGMTLAQAYSFFGPAKAALEQKESREMKQREEDYWREIRESAENQPRGPEARLAEARQALAACRMNMK